MAISIAAPRARHMVLVPSPLDALRVIANFVVSRAKAIDASLPDPERLGNTGESWRGPRSIALVHGGVGMP